MREDTAGVSVVAIKMEARTVGVRRGKSPLSNPGSESCLLLVTDQDKEKCQDNRTGNKIYTSVPVCIAEHGKSRPCLPTRACTMDSG